MVTWPHVEDRSWRSPSQAPGEAPRISIVTPSFNQGRFIEETILSVQRQNYPNLQYIVVDNCSSDSTADVLRRHSGSIDHLIVEPDSGQSNALNKGFSLADGDILAWLNADDMLAPGALWQVARAFQTAPRPDMVAGGLMYRVDEEVLYEHVTSVAPGPLHLENLLDIDAHWMLGRYFYQPEVFFSRSIFERAGGHLDESLFYSMDYDLWVRMAAAGAQLAVVGAPFAIFRGHPDQKTAQPENFLPELKQHARTLQARYDVTSTHIFARPVDKLKLLFVTDTAEGGAGLAHSRLCHLAQDLGHEANILYLRDKWTPDLPRIDVSELQEKVSSYEPDIVLIGNVHSIANAVDVLKAISLSHTTIFYAHDLWLATGRCAYPKGCTKLLNLCDQRCPTAAEYPPAPPSEIAALHSAKLRIQSLGDFRVFVGSRWMADVYEQVWRRHHITQRIGQPVTVLPPACDIGPFLSIDRSAARAALRLPQSSDVVVCSANNFADSRKGLAYLLDAFEALADREQSVLVIMVGWAHPEVRALAEPFSNVSFVGHAPSGMTPLIYGSADILLSAALDEAFGMVYVEAAAAGTRSVALRTGGVCDAVADGVSGTLVAELSGASLADAVQALLCRKRAGEDLSLEPRMWAASEHSDVAAVRRFADALAQAEPARSKGFVRTQLHRRRTLAEATNMLPASTPLRPVCVNRHTHVAGLGDVGYALDSTSSGSSFHLLRVMLDVSIERRPFHYDFKIVEAGQVLTLDLRPQESQPPIYSRALVEHGSPFFSDDWGPTLILPFGDGEALSLLERRLPSSEMRAFRRFASIVGMALSNPSVAANVVGCLEVEGFAASLTDLRSGLRAWAGDDPGD